MITNPNSPTRRHPRDRLRGIQWLRNPLTFTVNLLRQQECFRPAHRPIRVPTSR